MTTPQRYVLDQRPAAPTGVQRRPPREADLTQETITVSGYNYQVARVLSLLVDDVIRSVGPDVYERMEKDPTVMKCKQILISGLLADDLQMAASHEPPDPNTDPTEDPTADPDAAAKAYWASEILRHCMRIVAELENPLPDTLEQLCDAFGEAHKFGEITFTKRLDPPDEIAPDTPVTPRKAKNGATNLGPAPVKPRPRLMAQSIHVKPRNSYRLVSDTFNNVLGAVALYGPYRYVGSGSLTIDLDQLIPRQKFVLWTPRKKNEDPLGQSFYLPAFNYYNFKQHIPQEYLRFLLWEAVPGIVGILPPNSTPYEVVRDELGNVVYEDPDTKKQPKMMTATESMTRGIANIRNGTGVVVPNGADMRPLKTQSANGAVFPDAGNWADRQIQYAILLQDQAQSEGEHQGRGANLTARDILDLLLYRLKRGMVAQVIIRDIFTFSIKENYGDWALAFMPIVSLGDSERRNWAEDLKALADAYFKGLIDDTQRAQVCAWLNLPPPGKSRAELDRQAQITAGPAGANGAQVGKDGTPASPNDQRPDKQTGQRGRNNGNGRNNGAKQNALPNFSLRRRTYYRLANDGRRFEKSSGFVPGGAGTQGIEAGAE